MSLLNYHNPDLWRAWKGGSELRSLTPFPVDPLDLADLSGLRVWVHFCAKSLIFKVLESSDLPQIASFGLWREKAQMHENKKHAGKPNNMYKNNDMNTSTREHE